MLGSNAVLASDQELTVATVKPAAVQCIRWEGQKDGPQAVAQVLSKLEWIGKTTVSFMTYDRAMNLAVWIGCRMALRMPCSGHNLRRLEQGSDDSEQSLSIIHYRLLDCSTATVSTGLVTASALYATVNARFSLIAIGLSDNRIFCYAAKDYVGNIPISHTLSGQVHLHLRQARYQQVLPGLRMATACLWLTSMGGRLGAFLAKKELRASSAIFLMPRLTERSWLLCARTASWIGNGAEILLD